MGFFPESVRTRVCFAAGTRVLSARRLRCAFSRAEKKEFRTEIIRGEFICHFFWWWYSLIPFGALWRPLARPHKYCTKTWSRDCNGNFMFSNERFSKSGSEIDVVCPFVGMLTGEVYSLIKKDTPTTSNRFEITRFYWLLSLQVFLYYKSNKTFFKPTAAAAAAATHKQ